jgi:hypothetical protein
MDFSDDERSIKVNCSKQFSWFGQDLNLKIVRPSKNTSHFVWITFKLVIVTINSALDIIIFLKWRF